MNTSFIRPVPANLLTVDSRVQRVLDPRRVRLVASTWDDLMVGVLTVSHRLASDPAPDQLVVLDGQTRLAAFRAVCGEDTTAPLNCEVHEGLKLPEEALIFLQHNNRKAVMPVDRFRIALIAEEKWAVNIQGITARHGWYAQGSDIPESLSGRARRFSAVAAAERIYKMDDGMALTRVFETITSAWPNTSGTVVTETLNGLGLMYVRHPELDGHGLTVKLSKLGYGKFISSVGDYRRGNTGMSIAQAAYKFTLDLYNRGRQHGRGRIEV
jgi:hypothetical protein